MDPKSSGVLLSLTAFPGMNSNAPRGTVPAPELLLNVHLDRTGGYTPMWTRSLRLTPCTGALSAQVADNLFVEQSYGVAYWDARRGEVTPIVGAPLTLAGAITVMPDLLLTPNKWVHRTGAVQPPLPLQTSMLDTSVVESGEGVTGLPPSDVWDVIVQALPVPGAMYRGTVSYPNIGAGLTVPFRWNVGWPGSRPPLLRVFLRRGTEKFRYAGSNQADDGRLTLGVLIRTPQDTVPNGSVVNSAPAPTDDLRFTVASDTPSAYHQGRVFLAPLAATYTEIDGETEALVKSDQVPGRVYFSEVIASAAPDHLPTFTLVGYLDIPFRVSRRVVALESMGAYLYIFGDRELLILTGDPARDGRVESIGDSIGAVSPTTVQQLSGTVFWLSDSGVMAAQGANVREVGAEVRDLALGLDTQEVGSTVDFRRECYLLGDGLTLLCYHAREGGWTTREPEGTFRSSLLYGGGTPYLLEGNGLYSIGGEANLNGAVPPRLPMRVRFPRYELGDWRTRKTFMGVGVGLDLENLNATVTSTSRVDGVVSDTQVQATPASTGVRLHLSRDGVNMTGVTLALELTVSSQDGRAILRPPLTVYGYPSGEEAWTDNAL